MLVFWKICLALFSWNASFEICTFALLPTTYWSINLVNIFPRWWEELATVPNILTMHTRRLKEQLHSIYNCINYIMPAKQNYVTSVSHPYFNVAADEMTQLHDIYTSNIYMCMYIYVKATHHWGWVKKNHCLWKNVYNMWLFFIPFYESMTAWQWQPSYGNLIIPFPLHTTYLKFTRFCEKNFFVRKQTSKTP